MSDTQSLHALLDQTGWIHALARKLVTDPHLAADLAQDTCVQALEREPDSARPLHGWLAAVMRNQLAKLRRGERNRSAREQDQRRGESTPAALDVVERAEAHRNVVLSVLALDEPYRSAILMRFFEQLSYDDIARRTGITRAAVNSRVTRGLEQLRLRLEHTYGGDRRALCLALSPLAKLPTGVATTLLGVKVMHLAIGTAAASLLAVGISVGVSSSGRASSEPAPLVGAHPSAPARADEVELRAPFVLEPTSEPLEGARIALVPQQKDKKTSRVSDKDVWKGELSHVEPLAATIEALSVSANSGDVQIDESTSGQLEIVAKVHAQLGVVPNEQLTQIFEDHVDVHEQNGTLVIEDKHKNTRGWDVDLVVRVPALLPVSANSGSGDVIVRRAKGRVGANTGSGDVRVELANERPDAVVANTGSGDVVIEVLAVGKKLGANTGSGDVIVHVIEASSPGSASMNSGSGDVRLIVPAGIVGTFELETHSGSIELPPALGIFAQRDAGGRNHAQGTVGSGGGSYTLNSGSGDIGVELGNVLPEKAKK